MNSILVVTACLLAVCNAFDDRRPAQDTFPQLPQEKPLDGAMKDPNDEVLFVNVQAEDGKIPEVLVRI